MSSPEKGAQHNEQWQDTTDIRVKHSDAQVWCLKNVVGWGIGPACSTHPVALSGSSDQENPGKNFCVRHYVVLKMSGNIGTSGYLTSVSRAIFKLKTQGNPDKIKDTLNPCLQYMYSNIENRN